MLKSIRQKIVHSLWERYRDTTPDIRLIESALRRKNIRDLVLDHFAIIDLPGQASGIPMLKNIFAGLGFVERGKGYLADKQNDFLWMAEEGYAHAGVRDVLPQVVVADFRPQEMPAEISRIIDNYARQTRRFPLEQAQVLAASLQAGDSSADKLLADMLLEYFSGRDWPLPTIKEYQTVREFNELLAWVLIFGRRPNHFTLSCHLLDDFSSFTEFLDFVEIETSLKLNDEGGVIKGGKERGIAQGSTMGATQRVALADGEIEIAAGFIEFVWRYPLAAKEAKPALWNDYFTGFIAQHADRVIESLYTQNET